MEKIIKLNFEEWLLMNGNINFGWNEFKLREEYFRYEMDIVMLRLKNFIEC